MAYPAVVEPGDLAAQVQWLERAATEVEWQSLLTASPVVAAASGSGSTLTVKPLLSVYDLVL